MALKSQSCFLKIQRPSKMVVIKNGPPNINSDMSLTASPMTAMFVTLRRKTVFFKITTHTEILPKKPTITISTTKTASRTIGTPALDAKFTAIRCRLISGTDSDEFVVELAIKVIFRNSKVRSLEI